ncbi:MAG TPA: hypothetical protein VFV75_05975 [Candidatus Polarisedimenticolaceae bacterium]|nr:hypothetical protein [Candidatus Polarisedimenticolaceae bacterium]
MSVTAEGVYHFPLQVGNHWVYERRYPHGVETTWEVSVGDYSNGTGEQGFALHGYFAKDARVDYGPGGDLLEIAPDGGALLWYRLGAGVGSTWTPTLSGSMDPCTGGGRAILASHTEFVKVPAGEFADAVRVDYERVCMDAGLISEWFAPGVGLVKRTEDSIAGPIESVLLRSQVGGVMLPDHPVGTSLTLDRAQNATAGRAVQLQGAFRIHEQNSDGEAFAFAGCVSATVVLVDENGKPVLEKRIDDGGCCECKNLVHVFLHGETLMLPLDLEMVDAEGSPLPEGHYSLTATLDSLDLERVKPSATTHFHKGK